MVSEEDIFETAQVERKIKLLVYHEDARPNGVAWAAEPAFLSPNENTAGVFFKGPRKDFHQSGLSGAIVPEKGMYFRLSKKEIDIIDGKSPGKYL
jgi:hypothetical protein